MSSESAPFTKADLIAAFFADNGVPAVFELSGGMIAFLTDAVARLGKTPIINTRHEQAAGFAAEGGGWLTWVVGVDDVAPIEERLGRSAVDGHRVKPDGTDIRWKQIGVLGTLEDRQLPFFIQWIENHHPSTDGKAAAKIVKIEIAGDEPTITTWLGSDMAHAIGDGVEVSWLDPSANDGENGIVAVHLQTPGGVVRLD